MNRAKRRGAGFGLPILILLVLLPSLASASTSVGTLPGSHYFTARAAAPGAPPITIGAHLRVHLIAAPGYVAAGTQGSSAGLQGTTVVLGSCAAACTRNYRPASAPALPAGHYVERVTFTVTQPHHAVPAVGFDVEVAVHLTTGWVFGKGYFSTGVATGVATGATTATITLRFFVDLGAALPTITAVRVTVDPCGSTTGCP